MSIVNTEPPDASTAPSAPCKPEYVSIRRGRWIKTEITPPLAKLWTFEAPGKIVNAGAIDDRIFLTWGRTGWEVVDAATGESRRSFAKGPPHDEFLDVIPVPQSEVFLLGGMDHESSLWDMSLDERRPLDWRYACHLHDSVMLRDEGRAWRVKGSEVTEMFHAGGTIPPRANYGDGLSYVREKTAGTGSVRLTAVETITGVLVWERTFPFPDLVIGPHGRWLSLQACLQRDERHHLEVLDSLTGETLWSRTDPEAPAQKGARSAILGIYRDGIALLYSRPLQEVLSPRSFIRIPTGEHLWTPHENSSVSFATGRTLWLHETTRNYFNWNKSMRSFDDKEEKRAFVARDVETGAELIRMDGYPSPFAFAGRLYTLSGKKLTCWGPPDQAGKRHSVSLTLPAVRQKRTVSRTAAVRVDENSWEDLWYEFEGTGDDGRIPIRALLDALHSKFADVALHPGGILEIHNAEGRCLGRLFFEAQFLPEGTAEPCADTRIRGFRLIADDSIRASLHTALRKEKAVWDVTD